MQKSTDGHNVSALGCLADIIHGRRQVDILLQAVVADIGPEIGHICLGCRKVRRVKGKAVVRECRKVFGGDELEGGSS